MKLPLPPPLIARDHSGNSTTIRFINMRTALRKFKAWGLALVVVNLFLVSTVLGQTTYYSQTNGNPRTLANWNTNRAGGGSTPANFTTGDIFIIQGTGNGGTTPHTMTTAGGTWIVSGTNAQIQVENGATLNVANTTTTQRLTILSSGTVNITANVTLTVN